MSDAREEILARVRRALADLPDRAPGAEPAAESFETPIERDYLTAHISSGLVDVLAENLADYRAEVHRCTEAELPGTVARLLTERESRSVAIPDGLPDEWLEDVVGAADVRIVPEAPNLTARELDSVDAVVSGCALAIAETGTIVLDGGAAQGRRMLTLVPDHHVCVVRCPEQVVASVPQALPRLDPLRPQTWIAGPSATSDIELDRVEGVHGPRKLDVILVTAFS